MVTYSVRTNYYFKGGPGDQFMSGQWIGDSIQENVVFSLCTFNDVQAQFVNCVFIDCDPPPRGENCKNCTYIDLSYDVRLVSQRRDDEGNWE